MKEKLFLLAFLFLVASASAVVTFTSFTTTPAYLSYGGAAYIQNTTGFLYANYLFSTTGALTNATMGFNGTNYSAYDYSLIQSFNFDGVASIGDNATMVVDVSLGGNNGTWIGGQNITAGKYGSAGGFNTTNQLVTPLDVSALNTSSGYSVSFWYQWGGVTYNEHIWGCSYNQAPEVFSQSNGGVALTTVGVGCSETAPPNYPVWSWHYATFSYDPVTKNVTGYFDGKKICEVTVPIINGYNCGSDSKLAIGKGGGGSPFTGKVDELRVRNQTTSWAMANQSYLYNLAKYQASSWNFTRNGTSTYAPTNFTLGLYALDSVWGSNVTPIFVYNPMASISGYVVKSGAGISGANVTLASAYSTTSSVTGYYSKSLDLTALLGYPSTSPQNVSASVLSSSSGVFSGNVLMQSGNSTTQNLSLAWPFDDCVVMQAAGLPIASYYNFSYLNENFYLSTNVLVNSSVVANFNLTISNTSYPYFLTYYNVTYVCIGYTNVTGANNLTSTMYYSGTPGSNGAFFPQRQYYLVNALTAANSSVNLLLQNNFYYVEFDLKQPDLFPAAGLFVQVQKYFVQNNSYVLVAECQSDSFGICIVPLDVPNPSYRLVILDPTMTTIIDTKSQMQIPLSACSGTSCQKEIILGAPPAVFNPIPKIGQFVMSCNLTDSGLSNISFCNFTSLTGAQDFFNFSVTNMTTGAIVCLSTMQATSGVFTCSLGIIGDNLYLVQLKQGGLVQITQYIGNVLPIRVDWGTFGLLGGLILFIAIACIGAFNPRYFCLTVPLGLTVAHGLGLIRLGAVGSFNASAIGGVWVLGLLLWAVMRE